jgi:hypothetical protein
MCVEQMKPTGTAASQLTFASANGVERRRLQTLTQLLMAETGL